MISVAEALERVCASAAPLGGERVGLADALDRVAAEDVVSARSVPAAANSAMDGYAVRHADVACAPARLRVVAVEPAGTVVTTPLVPGAAVKLFTGSVIPPGADTVVRVEDTTQDGDAVVVETPQKAGANVRGAGEDIRPGQTVVARGTQLGPADLGMLASVGRATVVVHRRPRVVVLSTGSELVEIEETPAAGQVVNSNAWALTAAVRDAGGSPLALPIVRDRPEDIREQIAEGLRADVLLTTGGVSVGDLDFVKDALDAVHVERVFWKVAQKPGKPLAFGRAPGGALVFGLPGNPVSALVCFYVYVRPVLRRLQGHARIHLPVVRAALTAGVRKPAGLTEFLRVRLAEGPEGLLATPVPSQSSGVLSSLGAGAGLLVGPAERAELAAGEIHPVIVPGGLASARAPL